jgi:hypothetical protein
MRKGKKGRLILCLLLVVSTTTSTLGSTRACECAALPRNESAPVQEGVATSISTPKSCCRPAVQHRRCCSPASVDDPVACCCDKTESPFQSSAPAQKSGCKCLQCNCAGPSFPPTTPSPPSSLCDANEWAVPSPVPPIDLALPALAAAPLLPPLSQCTSHDLVISLARLTC